MQKLPEKALLSKTYFKAVEVAESDIIISHIRHASCGEKNERNCHPFVRQYDGRDWVFAHNGHVDGLYVHPLTTGETDSESVFHILMDNIEDQRDVMSGLQYGITSLFEDYEFGRQIRLNFLLSDGTNVYAFGHHPEKPMYYQNLYHKQGARTMVSTQVLDGTPWVKLPSDRLLIVAQGQIQSISAPV